MSSNMFSELIRRSKRISRDEFAINFGGIADDVVEMLESEQAREAVHEARTAMETAAPLSDGQPRLRETDFGYFSQAPELEKGMVAAVDGTTALPIQLYSAGQALCVGIGSLSYRRAMQDTLHYWSSKAYLGEATSTDDFLGRQEDGLFGISQTAYMRYFEIKHGVEIDEPIVLFDGTLVYEWLVATQEGVQLYKELFHSGKQCLGIMKNIKANAKFATFARALKSGEVYIIETLYDHLMQSNTPNKNQGEGGQRYVLPEFLNGVTPHILRGIFKPAKKAFGFEVYDEHLDEMLRIMAADCQLNNVGHEIPFLLNRVDEEVRHTFNQSLLSDRIATQMATQSEELFFEETNERAFR